MKLEFLRTLAAHRKSEKLAWKLRGEVKLQVDCKLCRSARDRSANCDSTEINRATKLNHNSRPLRAFDRDTICYDYMWLNVSRYIRTLSWITINPSWSRSYAGWTNRNKNRRLMRNNIFELYYRLYYLQIRAFYKGFFLTREQFQRLSCLPTTSDVLSASNRNWTRNVKNVSSNGINVYAYSQGKKN